MFNKMLLMNLLALAVLQACTPDVTAESNVANMSKTIGQAQSACTLVLAISGMS